MSEFLEIKKMLSDHMNQSNEGISEIKQSIARIEVKGDYAAKAIESHEKAIEVLNSAHNKQKGAIGILSLIGLGGLFELIKQWVK